MSETYARLRGEWFPVALESDLSPRKAIGRSLLGTPLVLFQASDTVAVMLDRCPHRNAPLSMGKIVGHEIQCPYHGWRFSKHGTCSFRPGCQLDSSQGVPSFAGVVHDGLLWVNLSVASTEMVPPNLHHDPWTEKEFGCFHWQETLRADFKDALENLLDATHTPFVHAGLIRSQSQTQNFKATVRVRDGVAEAQYCEEGKQNGWISRIFERDRSSSFGRFIPPCIAELEYTSKAGTEFVLRAYFVPENHETIRLIAKFYIRKTKIPFVLKRLAVTPFFKGVLRQDRKILEVQQRNVKRFGGTNYQYWEGDLLRGLIDSWVRNGKFPSNSIEHEVSLTL